MPRLAILGWLVLSTVVNISEAFVARQQQINPLKLRGRLEPSVSSVESGEEGEGAATAAGGIDREIEDATRKWGLEGGLLKSAKEVR